MLSYHARKKCQESGFLNKTLAWIILSVFVMPVSAQQNAVIQGLVRDAETSQPLPGANIVIVGTQRGAASDENGNFEVRNVPPGDYELAVLMIGYETHRANVSLKSSQRLDLQFSLKPVALKGGEVSVEAERVEDARLEISPATFDISPRLIQTSAGAFEDVLRAVQALPGVTTPSDLSNQFIVRGGSPEQNLIIMDGVELYSPYRRNGMASVFNPALVQDVRLYAGGFPALFGDRLSSVLAVNLREGTTTKWLGGRVSANATNANLVLEGKTGFLNGSWIVSSRRSFYDLFAEDFVRDIGIVNDVAFPDFEDRIAKLVLRPSAKHRLQFTGFYSRNNMDYLVKEQVGEQVSDNPVFDGDDQMKNTIYGGSWSFIPSEKLQGRVYANWYRNQGASDFGGSLYSHGSLLGKDFFDGELIYSTPLGGEADTLAFDYAQNYKFDRLSSGGWMIYQTGNHIVEAGFGADFLDNTLASTLDLDQVGKNVFDALYAASGFLGALADTVTAESPYSRWHVYFQDKISFFENRASVQPGVRLDYYGTNDQFYASPRLAARLEIDPLTSARFSFGLFRQSPGYEKFLDGGRIFDLLRFSSISNLNVESGTHNIFGLTRKLDDRFELSVETYWKQLNDLLTQDYELATVPVARPIGHGPPATPAAYFVESGTVLRQTPNPVNDATVKAYGLDLRLEKRAFAGDRWSGSFSYSLGKATQEQTINGRRIAPAYQYDRRHTLNLAVNYNMFSNFHFGVNWNYGSGFPYTPALRVDPIIGVGEDPFNAGDTTTFIITDPATGYVRFIPDFGPPENINSARLPDYHRLDVRLAWRSNSNRAPFEFYIDLVNVYNRKNVFQYESIIRIEGDDQSLPESLRFPKPALFSRPIYMLPFVPSVGFNVAF